jgi:hypothetical protein
MATPTFVAGFCTVLAAILAYGTTQTHLLYSNGLPPACAEASCSTASPQPGNGGPLGESASPGITGTHGTRPGRPQQAPEQPATGGGGGGARPDRSPGTHAGHRAAPQHQAHPPGGSRGPDVAVVYHTQKRWSGRFTATVTIINNGQMVLSGWQLRMNYRRVKIDSLWGARWFPASPSSGNGLVAAPAGQRPLRPGMSARFSFRAGGVPGQPGGCAFDGYRCTYRNHRPDKRRKSHNAGPGKKRARTPGTSRAHNPGTSRARNPGSVSVNLTGLVVPTATRLNRPRAKANPSANGHPHAKSHPQAKGHPRHVRATRTPRAAQRQRPGPPPPP